MTTSIEFERRSRPSGRRRHERRGPCLARPARLERRRHTAAVNGEIEAYERREATLNSAIAGLGISERGETRWKANSPPLSGRNSPICATATKRTHNGEPMKNLPLSKVYRLLELGPVVLLTTAHKGRDNVMTMSWHMMVEFEPPLIACVVSNRDSQLRGADGDEGMRDRDTGGGTGGEGRRDRQLLGSRCRQVRGLSP